MGEYAEAVSILGSVGEFVSGVAVLVTLLFLVFQLRQNTRVLNSSAREWYARNYGVLAAPILPSPELGELLARAHREDSRQFTPGERERIGWLLFASLKSAETQHIAWREGDFADQLYQPLLVSTRNFVQSYRKFFPRYWAVARTSFSDDFRDLVDSFVDEMVDDQPRTNHD